MVAEIYYVDEEHYDVKGRAYEEFIERCFCHASYFSLVSTEMMEEKILLEYGHIEQLLKPYLVYKKENTDYWPGTWVDDIDPHARKKPNFYVYNCCPETERIIKKQSPSLFSWEGGRPEDLTFYYENKKIFLVTITHEAICIISCTPEVFREFKDFNYWHISNETEFLEETYF